MNSSHFPVLVKHLDDLLTTSMLGAATEGSKSQLGMAILHLQEGNPEKAGPLIEKALESTIDVPGAWLARGYAAALLPDQDMAFLSATRTAIAKAHKYIVDEGVLAKHSLLIASCTMASMATFIRSLLKKSDAEIGSAQDLAQDALKYWGAAALSLGATVLEVTRASDSKRSGGARALDGAVAAAAAGGVLLSVQMAEKRGEQAVQHAVRSHLSLVNAASACIMSRAAVIQCSSLCALAPADIQEFNAAAEAELRSAWVEVAHRLLRDLQGIAEQLAKGLRCARYLPIDITVNADALTQHFVVVDSFVRRMGIRHAHLGDLSRCPEDIQKTLAAFRADHKRRATEALITVGALASPLAIGAVIAEGAGDGSMPAVIVLALFGEVIVAVVLFLRSRAQGKTPAPVLPKALAFFQEYADRFRNVKIMPGDFNMDADPAPLPDTQADAVGLPRSN